MKKAEKITLFLAALLLAVSIYIHFDVAVVGDTELLLVEACKLLDGKHLYKDVFTVLQPLIYWLYMAPGELGRLSGIPAGKLLPLMGLCIATASICACDRLLASHPAFARSPKDRARHALLLALVFITFTSPLYFADREHLFLMLTFPYLLRFMPSLSGTAFPRIFSIAIGCMAGVGFCIKPHCAIVFSVAQLLYVLRTRRLAILWSVENLFVYAVASSYMASILIFTPDYARIVLPMAVATYSAASQRIDGLFYIANALAILGVALVDLQWRKTTPYRRDIYYMLGLCVAFLLYALSNNGWAYTYNPLLNLSLVVAGWALWDYLWLMREAQAQGLPARKFLFGARACGFVLAVSIPLSAANTLFAASISCPEHLKCHQWGRELIAAVDGAHSFGSISGDFETWARLSDMTGVRWDTRFNHLWMLPKFLISDDDFARRNRWILQYVADALADDMDTRKPNVMFVDNSDIFYLTPVHVDLVPYFSVFPRFRAAWTHYALAQSIHTCPHPGRVHCGFDVYRRKL